MNKVESNKMKMYRAIDTVVASHPETVNSIAPLAEAYGAFRVALGNIIQYDRQYQNSTSGATATKNVAHDQLVESALFVSKVLYSFGRKTNNEEVKASCKVTPTTLARLRDGQLEETCFRLHQFVTTFAASMNEYGITAEQLELFKTRLENYRLYIDSQQHKIAESKAARDQLYQAFDKADEILKEDLDRLIEVVKNQNHELYITYKAARVIRDLGGSHSPKAGKIDAVIVTEKPVAVVQPVE